MRNEEWHIIGFDNGSDVYLSSFSGGASKEGLFGRIKMMKIDADGSVHFRDYIAINDWRPSTIQPRSVKEVSVIKE